MILAGSIGQKTTHLGLFNVSEGGPALVREERAPASQYASLQDAVNAFMQARQGDVDEWIDAACFGFAGPMKAGGIERSNLPWVFDELELRHILGVQKFALINDVEAKAYGTPMLSPEDFAVLQEGAAPAEGHQALVSAGNELQEALLIWDGVQHTPIHSEGGQCDFAPRNAEGVALLRYLQRSLSGRVSCEMVVSDIGMRNIYEFWRDDQHMQEEAWLRERLQEEDPTSVVAECAQNGSSEICIRTVQMFCSTYGAIAGDSALRLLTRGGIYLGGEIPQKVLPSLQGSSFLDAFLDKGRMRPLMETLPIKVIVQPSCALIGAAAYAQARLLAAGM